MTLLFGLANSFAGRARIDRERELARTDLLGRQEGAVAAILVQAIGLEQIAGDDVEIAVAVDVDQLDIERQIGNQRLLVDLGKLEIEQIAHRLADDVEHTADVAAFAELAGAVVQIAAIELAEAAGNEVEVAVVVDVAQRNVGGDGLVAADIVTRGRAGEWRRRAVVEIEPVVGAVGQLGHGRDDRQDFLVRVGSHDHILRHVDDGIVPDVGVRRIAERTEIQRSTERADASRLLRCRTRRRQAAQRAFRVQIDVRRQRGGAIADRRFGLVVHAVQVHRAGDVQRTCWRRCRRARTSSRCRPSAHRR